MTRRVRKAQHEQRKQVLLTKEPNGETQVKCQAFKGRLIMKNPQSVFHLEDKVHKSPAHAASSNEEISICYLPKEVRRDSKRVEQGFQVRHNTGLNLKFSYTSKSSPVAGVKQVTILVLLGTDVGDRIWLGYLIAKVPEGKALTEARTRGQMRRA